MPLKNLKMIIEFIVGVYMPNWFKIKVKHNWIDGPRHVLFQFELLKSQDKEVIQIVMPIICSDQEEERKVGIEKILEIRGNAEKNFQTGPHTFKVLRDVSRWLQRQVSMSSQERKDGYIKSLIVSRQLMSRNATKKDMYNFVKFGNN
ncbi:hypothetical protein HELRODRAFT_162962 [Helobdella robusta]|uniref:Uncharacterized protein n=1 Tax=Helobdella robusta TaxID=6412 RepID=T1ETF7_HELRO|nr:hypothetical protein HELRODRAFT_162962 [Helobdella robusta]ESN99414.1 hypothetical protein HELRODRAFT_162962 [Helobdella robusta]